MLHIAAFNDAVLGAVCDGVRSATDGRPVSDIVLTPGAAGTHTVFFRTNTQKVTLVFAELPHAFAWSDNGVVTTSDVSDITADSAAYAVRETVRKSVQFDIMASESAFGVYLARRVMKPRVDDVLRAIATAERAIARRVGTMTL